MLITKSYTFYLYTKEDIKIMLDIIYLLIIIILLYIIVRFMLPLLIATLIIIAACIRYIYINLKSKFRKVR